MKVLLFANTDWYLYNFRLPLAEKLRADGHEVVLVSPAGKYSLRLAELGFRHVPFTFSRRGVLPTKELGVILRLYALYRREHPDLVHHFTIKCVLYGSLAARIAGGFPVINAVPGLGHVFLTRGLGALVLRPLVKTLYRFALRGTNVVFQNPDDRETFIKAGLIQSDAVHLIRGSGVDCDKFQPFERPETEELVILFAGRLLVSKGVAEYVQAAALAKQSIPSLRFIAAGEPDPGNPATISQEALRQWQESGVVEFVGQRDDMPLVISKVDIAVLPSYGEGLPRFLLEAAASGLPLIAADVPGCREIVRHGVNGLLVPVRDHLALSRAIITLALDRSLRKAMGAESRRIACSEFSQTEVVRETQRIYTRVLPDSRVSEVRS